MLNSHDSLAPDFPTPTQVSTVAAQPLQGATLDGDDRILFNDPREKITYDAVTGVPGQEDGAGEGMFAHVGNAATTNPAMQPDLVYDLSKDVPEEPKVRWKTWVITIAVLVAFLLCMGMILLRGRGASSAGVSNGGYGGGGYGGTF